MIYCLKYDTIIQVNGKINQPLSLSTGPQIYPAYEKQQNYSRYLSNLRSVLFSALHSSRAYPFSFSVWVICRKTYQQFPDSSLSLPPSILCFLLF